MTNQVNQEAFDKWVKANYPEYHPLLSKVWKAATQASESEINSLKQRVEELEKYDLMQKSKLITQRVQITELTESNNQLREALGRVLDLLAKTKVKPTDYNFDYIEQSITLIEILSSTPTQSLAEHDNE